MPASDSVSPLRSIAGARARTDGGASEQHEEDMKRSRRRAATMMAFLAAMAAVGRASELTEMEKPGEYVCLSFASAAQAHGMREYRTEAEDSISDSDRFLSPACGRKRRGRKSFGPEVAREYLEVFSRRCYTRARPWRQWGQPASEGCKAKRNCDPYFDTFSGLQQRKVFSLFWPSADL